MKETKVLFCICVVTFTSFLGIAMPFSIMAPLFLTDSHQLGLGTINISKSLLLGITLGVYPLGQFLGAPFLGSFSDSLGRKKILLIAKFFTLLGYLISAWALIYNNFLLFLFCRFFTGFWEGNMAIARAIATDLSHKIDKPKSFGYISAAATAGYLCGPIIGGFLSDASIHPYFSHHLPFAVSAIISLLAFVIVYFWLEETNTNVSLLTFDQYKTKLSVNFFKNLIPLQLFTNKRLLTLIFIAFFITIGFDVYYQFYPVLFVQRWGFNEFKIASFSTLLTVSMIFTQIFLISLSKRFLKIETLLIFFSVCYAVALFCFSLQSSHYTSYITFPILGICIGVLGSHLLAYVSDKTSNYKQGSVMGVLMSLRYLGDALICIVGGFLSSFSVVYTMLIGVLLVIL